MPKVKAGFAVERLDEKVPAIGQPAFLVSGIEFYLKIIINIIKYLPHMHFVVQRSAIARQTQFGFSLVELLVTIAILGIVSLIGVNSFGGARQGAVDQKDMRNAQEIASMAAVARAAGAQFVVLGDEKASIENLRAGCTPVHGAFKGCVFQLPNLAESEINGAMRFLALNDTEIQYRLDGSY
jgi:prepilin-type N-terminal cleavage/methylation domain-containing protein